MTEKQEKLVNLMKNKEFLDKVMVQESVADVQRLFKSEGVELSEADVEALGDIIDIALQKGEILNDEIIEKVSAGISEGGAMTIGGIVGTLVGFVGCTALGLGVGSAVGSVVGAKIADKELSRNINCILPNDERMRIRTAYEKKYSDSGLEHGGVIGASSGILGGALAGVFIAKSLCRWKKR